jgi:hypothetical protein
MKFSFTVVATLFDDIYIQALHFLVVSSVSVLGRWVIVDDIYTRVLGFLVVSLVYVIGKLVIQRDRFTRSNVFG